MTTHCERQQNNALLDRSWVELFQGLMTRGTAQVDTTMAATATTTAPTRPSRSRILWLVTACGAVLLTLLTGCGPQGVELNEDDQLTDQLQQLRRSGGSSPLKQLVPGDWDTVYSFAEPVSREHIERTTGARIDMEEIFSAPGNVLVFTNAGTAEQAISVEVNLFDGQYESTVEVVADVPNTGRLRLVNH